MFSPVIIYLFVVFLLPPIVTCCHSFIALALVTPSCDHLQLLFTQVQFNLSILFHYLLLFLMSEDKSLWLLPSSSVNRPPVYPLYEQNPSTWKRTSFSIQSLKPAEAVKATCFWGGLNSPMS